MEEGRGKLRHVPDHATPYHHSPGNASVGIFESIHLLLSAHTHSVFKLEGSSVKNNMPMTQIIESCKTFLSSKIELEK